MLVWMTATALGSAPADVDVAAVEVWQARAIQLRRGPQACWRLEGTAKTHVAVYRPPSLFGRADQSDYVYAGTFEGTLDDGQWTRFRTEMAPASEAAKEGKDGDGGTNWNIPVHPFVGRSVPHDDDGSDGMSGQSSTEEAVSLVDRLLDEMDADVTTTFSEWSDERGGVSLVEHYPLGSKQVELVTFFPGGQPAAAALDVTFPHRYRVPVDGAPIRITLLRPQLHLRAQTVDGEALPVYESVSLAAGAFGFTVGFEQTLTYTKATACAPTPSEGP